MKKIFEYWPLFFLIFFSFLTRFFYLSYPDKVVFDEAHFGLYATKHLKGEYYFDIHPPLGKMMYASVAYAVGIQPGFYFEKNSPYGEFNYLALRALPAFVGSLFVILIYFFCLEIGASKKAAFISSFLVLFDNALIVESRLILLNIFLLFFIFLSLLLFFRAQKQKKFSKKWYLFNVLCGLALGAAISVKWIGFVAVLLILFLNFLKQKKSLKEILFSVFFFILIPLLIYLLIFYLHFKLLPNPCLENCGFVLDKIIDVCPTCFYFNEPPRFSNFWGKFLWVNWLMKENSSGGNKDIFYPQGNPNASFFWQWPLMLGGFPYFSEATSNGKISQIYLIGNPVVWRLALLGMVIYVFLVIAGQISKNQRFKNQTGKIPSVIVLGFCLFWLIFIPIKRATYLYHYFPVLVFSIIIFSIFFESFLNHLFKTKKANLLLVIVLISVFFAFIFVSPLTYGFFILSR